MKQSCVRRKSLNLTKNTLVKCGVCITVGLVDREANNGC
jgi:hypothetical protein